MEPVGSYTQFSKCKGVFPIKQEEKPPFLVKQFKYNPVRLTFFTGNRNLKNSIHK